MYKSIFERWCLVQYVLMFLSWINLFFLLEMKLHMVFEKKLTLKKIKAHRIFQSWRHCEKKIKQCFWFGECVLIWRMTWKLQSNVGLGARLQSAFSCCLSFFRSLFCTLNYQIYSDDKIIILHKFLWVFLSAANFEYHSSFLVGDTYLVQTKTSITFLFTWQSFHHFIYL